MWWMKDVAKRPGAIVSVKGVAARALAAADYGLKRLLTGGRTSRQRTYKRTGGESAVNDLRPGSE
jgi:hypothetical protein